MQEHDRRTGSSAQAGAVGRRMLDFAREVVSTLDVEIVLERVLEMARDVTDAQYAALGVLDEGRVELERFLTLGIDDETRRALGPLPRGRGVLGELIRNPEPLRLEDVGRHPRSYGFPVGHPRMTTFLGVPIVIDGTSFGNLYLAEKRSGMFDEADEEAVITLAGWAAVAIQNARVHGGVAKQRDEFEQSVAALSAMTDIALALGGETDVDAMLELVAKRARALVSARAMLVGVVDAGEIVVAATAGDVTGEIEGARLPLGRSEIGAAVESRSARTLDAAAVRSAIPSGLNEDLGLAALAVPLIFRSRALGVLVALDRISDGPAFTDRDAQRLQAFATTAGAALATARTAAADLLQSRLAAAEVERNRWARELHDETLQALAMLRMTLAGARRRGDIDSLSDAVETALEHIDQQIASLRGLIAELRPTALDDLGLVAALEAFVERAVTLGGDIEIDLDLDLDYEAGRTPLRHTPELEAAVYRIAQEAIANAVKHASATHIEVAIHESETLVELRVRDDGAGFDAAAVSSGFGLTGMRERAELAGGSLTVTSAPGAGTCVDVRLPIARRHVSAPGIHPTLAGE